MSGMITPGNLTAAQMMTFAKGQEVHATQSSERKEQQRRMVQQLKQAKEADNRQHRANGAQKSFLA